jgi:hypothetical protein
MKLMEITLKIRPQGEARLIVYDARDDEGCAALAPLVSAAREASFAISVCVQ